jgi:hypothetical protein
MEKRYQESSRLDVDKWIRGQQKKFREQHKKRQDGR